jgi:hypothetical protein
MACCGKGLKIPKENQKLVEDINKNISRHTGGAIKSNRTPAGTIAKQCPNCGTKTIVNICPICFTKL